MNILNDTNIPPNYYLTVGKMYADAKRWDLLAVALQKYLQREPANPRVWIDLAAVYVAMNQTDPSLNALKRAVEIGGEPVRDIVRKDPRFDAIRERAEFKQIIPPIQTSLPMNLPTTLPMF